MNKHRGSDFNEFMIEQGIMTPTPTPRTDAIAHQGLGSVAYIAEMTNFARELESALGIWKHELKRLEDELEQERQDRKQADLDTIRALGERNEARAELAVWKHDVKRLEAELKTFDEKAIEWWCEYQDLKAKARES